MGLYCSPEMIWVSCAHLWSRVAGRSAGGLEFLVLVVEVAQAEVDDFDVKFPVDQDVRGLDVAVRAAHRVQVADRAGELAEEPRALFLGESGEQRVLLARLDVVAELALLRALHHEEEVLAGLDHLLTQAYLVQLDDVRVAHASQDVYFSSDPQQVVFFLDLVFLQDLYRDLLPRDHVQRLLHLAERTLAQGPQHDELFVVVVLREPRLYLQKTF